MLITVKWAKVGIEYTIYHICIPLALHTLIHARNYMLEANPLSQILIIIPYQNIWLKIHIKTMHATIILPILAIAKYLYYDKLYTLQQVHSLPGHWQHLLHDQVHTVAHNPPQYHHLIYKRCYCIRPWYLCWSTRLLYQDWVGSALHLKCTLFQRISNVYPSLSDTSRSSS